MKRYHAMIPLGIILAHQVGCAMPSEMGELDAPTSARVVLLEIPVQALSNVGVEATWGGVSLSVSLLRTGVTGTGRLEEPLSGADVRVIDPWGQSFEVGEDPDLAGFYQRVDDSSEEAGLKYYPGSMYQVEIEHHGTCYKLGDVVPDYPQLASPTWAQTLPVGEPLEVVWSPSESPAVVTVVDEAGELAFSNAPETAEEVQAFMNSAARATTWVPREIFDAQQRYGVAVAAMRNSDWTQGGDSRLSPNLNPEGSMFLSGASTVIPVDVVATE